MDDEHLFTAVGGPVGRTRLAYLLAPVYLRDAAADSAFPLPAYFEGKPYIGERFIEENTAIA